jgi:hypothetical protein
MAMYPRDVDERNFAADEDEAPCLSCGAGPHEPCDASCGCDSCRRVRERLRRQAEIEATEPDLLMRADFYRDDANRCDSGVCFGDRDVLERDR